MVLLDIINHEIGFLELIIQDLTTNELTNLLIVRKWEEEYRKIIINKILCNTLEYFEYKKYNIILPWKESEGYTITNVINFINSYDDNVIVKRTNGISLGKFSYDDMAPDIRRRVYYETMNTFIHEDDPQYVAVLCCVNVDRPHKDTYNTDTECYIGVKCYDPDIPVPYWEKKEFMLLPPNIHRELCKKLTRNPVELKFLQNHHLL